MSNKVLGSDPHLGLASLKQCWPNMLGSKNNKIIDPSQFFRNLTPVTAGIVVGKMSILDWRSGANLKASFNVFQKLFYEMGNSKTDQLMKVTL